jgi:hypothetical protein
MTDNGQAIKLYTELYDAIKFELPAPATDEAYDDRMATLKLIEVCVSLMWILRTSTM